MVKARDFRPATSGQRLLTFVLLTLILLGLALISPSSIAQSQKRNWWFEIEVLVFKRDSDAANASTDEHFGYQMQPIRVNRARDLLTPFLYPNLSAIKGGLPYCREQNNHWQLPPQRIAQYKAQDAFWHILSPPNPEEPWLAPNRQQQLPKYDTPKMAIEQWQAQLEQRFPTPAHLLLPQKQEQQQEQSQEQASGMVPETQLDGETQSRTSGADGASINVDELAAARAAFQMPQETTNNSSAATSEVAGPASAPNSANEANVNTPSLSLSQQNDSLFASDASSLGYRPLRAPAPPYVPPTLHVRRFMQQSFATPWPEPLNLRQMAHITLATEYQAPQSQDLQIPIWQNAPVMPQADLSLKGLPACVFAEEQTLYFANEQPDWQKPLPVAGTPVIVNASEKPYSRHPYLLPSSRLQLGKMRRNLNRKRGINTLLHLAWRQRVKFGRNNNQSMRLFAGKNYSEQFNYQGLPIQGLSPQGQEELTPAQTDRDREYQNSRLINAVASILASEQTSVNYPIDGALELPPMQLQNYPDQVWELDGLFKIYLQEIGAVPYLHIDSQLNFREPVDIPNILLPESSAMSPSDDGNFLQSYHFQQLRRVISTQIHYFDHPKFGMVVQIRRHTRPRRPDRL